jgi:outer membrane protein assembly factor BamB
MRLELGHGLHRGLIVCGLLVLLAGSARSQTSLEVAMVDGNAQRSRVLNTQGVDTPPQQWLWQSERLFQIRYSTPISNQFGNITIRGEMPTFHSFTFPIVSQGIIFFTLYVDNAYFYAVDANTGKQLVTLKFDNNRLSAPAALGQVAFFGTSSGKVYAYDTATRSMKWTYEGQGSFSYSSPVIDDGVVYICGAGDGIVALAADTGAVKWRIKADQMLYRPAIKGDNLVVYGVEGMLLSLDKKTGARNWQTKLGRNFGGTAILDDQVFVKHDQGEIRAYSLADGTLRWKSNKDGGTETNLALFKDTVFYGEEYGNIVALDAHSAAQKWKFKTKKWCLGPIIAGETVYTSCGDHYLYALDAQTGQLKWKFDWQRDGPLPTFSNGVMYFLSTTGILQAAK